MRAAFVTLFILIGFIFGFFVLWMNLTPGRYQRVCHCGTVIYITDAQKKGLEKNVCPPSTSVCVDSKATKTVNDMLLLISQLDTYR